MVYLGSSSLQVDSAQVGWLGLRVGSHLALFNIHEINCRTLKQCVLEFVKVMYRILLFSFSGHGVFEFLQ